MNFAHVHLILNHLPIVGVPLVLLFLLNGLRIKNAEAIKFSLLVAVALALVVLPVYFTGEPAEEFVEHLPGVSESVIHPHEEAGEISLILMMAAGASAVVALWFRKNEARLRGISFVVAAFLAASSVSLLITGNLGGQIRHTEFRTGASKGETPAAAESYDKAGSEDAKGVDEKTEKNEKD